MSHAVPPVPPNQHVGQPIERIEDLRLLRGEGLFVDDLPRSGVVYAAVLRSPVAHGQLRGIDSSAAMALPGVIAVITAETLGMSIPVIPMRQAPLEQLAPYFQPVIASGKLR